jgi:hypothetical protein
VLTLIISGCIAGDQDQTSNWLDFVRVRAAIPLNSLSILQLDCETGSVRQLPIPLTLCTSKLHISAEIAADAHRIIRAEVATLLGASVASAMRILYGGGVKPDNATALISQEEIDGRWWAARASSLIHSQRLSGIDDSERQNGREFNSRPCAFLQMTFQLA